MKNHLKISIILISTLPLFHSFAQDQNLKSQVKVSAFSAQVLVSTDLEAVYFNLVGSGIKYTRGNSSFQLGVFPTIRIYKDPNIDPATPKPLVVPGFSAGLLYSYKRFMVAAPAYYKDNKWHYTMGMGFKIGQYR